MRFLFWLRVAVVSLEAFLLGSAWLAWSQYRDVLVSLAEATSPSAGLLNYLLGLPLALFAWIAHESRQLLHEDKQTTQVLTAWPDYWRLKVHIWVALCYALLFAIASIAPWMVGTGISCASGLLLCTLGLVGQLVVCASVYAARFRVREYVVNSSAT